jgi:outer membrane protein OmpA-like peptidoglycan-associated protein
MELNEQELLDADAQARAVKLKELQVAQAAIEQVALHFPVDSIDIGRGQEEVLARLVATIQTLFTAARFVGYDVQVDAIGRADRTGIAKKNAMLRQQRAERVVAELATRGLLAEQIAIFRSRAAEPLHGEDTSQDLAADRSVTFEVRVADRQKKLE